MDIRSAVNREPLIIRELLAPSLLVAVYRPVVAIKSAPENRLSRLEQILLRHHATVIGFDIHNADGIIR